MPASAEPQRSGAERILRRLRSAAGGIDRALQAVGEGCCVARSQARLDRVIAHAAPDREPVGAGGRAPSAEARGRLPAAGARGRGPSAGAADPGLSVGASCLSIEGSGTPSP
ncbi:MAG TPA: hypothetical protein VKV27_15600 [Solirubrobacteraceae bacterium]|nr:hypothetical protein [Solirubrobacteraceae bacterium]